MKKKTLQPQVTAPVPRVAQGTAVAQSSSDSVDAAQYAAEVAASVVWDIHII